MVATREMQTNCGTSFDIEPPRSRVALDANFAAFGNGSDRYDVLNGALPRAIPQPRLPFHPSNHAFRHPCRPPRLDGTLTELRGSRSTHRTNTHLVVDHATIAGERGNDSIDMLA